jgi:hypothetical protein
MKRPGQPDRGQYFTARAISNASSAGAAASDQQLTGARARRGLPHFPATHEA